MMRLTFLSILLLCVVFLGCNDNESIDPVAKLAEGTVRLEWIGPNVHSITVGESTGIAGERECESSNNVWWARQPGNGDPPLLISPFRIGDTPSGVLVGGAPTFSKGKRYLARLDRNEVSGHARAHGCVAFDF